VVKLENMEEAELKPRSKHGKSKLLPILSAILMLLLIIGISGWWLIHRSETGPIPKKIKNGVKFAIYYPNNLLPRGYELQKDSVKQENGLVTYTLQNGDKQIYVTEQSAPPRPPDLSVITNYKKVDTFAGQAAIGTDRGAPIAFLVSNTTMVNMRATKDVPNDVLARTLQAMSALP
jgi:flagellar basal body-associated protein FliL